MILTLILLFQSFCSFHVKLDPKNSTYFQNLPKLLIIADSISNSLDPKPKKGNIIQHEKHFYLLYDGYSHVFRFENENFIQISKDDVHGYNFGRSIFMKSDTIFSYGGAGFWIFYPEISFFDVNSGKWKNISTKSKKPLFDGGIQEFAFLKDNKLFAFFTETFPHSPIREKIDLKNGKLQIFDFEKNSWISSKSLDRMNKVHFNYKVETENFFIIYDSGFPVWLLDKKRLNLYLLNKNERKFGFFNRDFAENNHLITLVDSVWIFSSGSNPKLLQSFDFAKDFLGLKKDKFMFKNKPEKNSISIYLALPLLGVILMVFLIGLNLNRMRIFKHPDFLFKTGIVFSREELYSLVQENELRDSTKIGKLLIIQRIKNSKDKRLFDYTIHCQGNPFLFSISLILFKKFFYKEEAIEA